MGVWLAAVRSDLFLWGVAVGVAVAVTFACGSLDGGCRPSETFDGVLVIPGSGNSGRSGSFKPGEEVCQLSSAEASGVVSRYRRRKR